MSESDRESSETSPPDQHPQVLSYSGPHPSDADEGKPPVDSVARWSFRCGLLFFFTPVLPLLTLALASAGIARTRSVTRDRSVAYRGLALAMFGMAFWILVAFAWATAQAPTQRTHCLSNLRQLGTYIMMYTTQHNGQYPDSLETLVDALVRYPGFLTCPASEQTPLKGPVTPALIAQMKAGGHVSYVYVYPGPGPIAASPKRIIAYDPASHQARGMCVLYSDGSARWLPASEAIQTLQWLEDQQAGLPPRNPPTPAPVAPEPGR